MSLKTFFLARGSRKGALALLRLELSTALGEIAQSRQATPLIDGVKAALESTSDRLASGFVEFIRVEKILKVSGKKFTLNKGTTLDEESIEAALVRFDKFFENWFKAVEKSAEEKAADALEKENKYRTSLLEKLKEDSSFFSWVKTQVNNLEHQVLTAKLTPITRGELEKLTT